MKVSELKRKIYDTPFEIDFNELNNGNYEPLDSRRIANIRNLVNKSHRAYRKGLYIELRKTIILDEYKRKKIKKRDVSDVYFTIDDYDKGMQGVNVNENDLVEMISKSIRIQRTDLNFTITNSAIRLVILILTKVIVRLVMSDHSVDIKGFGKFRLRRKVNNRGLAKSNGLIKLVSVGLSFIPDKNVNEMIDDKCGVIWNNLGD